MGLRVTPELVIVGILLDALRCPLFVLQTTDPSLATVEAITDQSGAARVSGIRQWQLITLAV
jgi:hypothetical protein